MTKPRTECCGGSGDCAEGQGRSCPLPACQQLHSRAWLLVIPLWCLIAAAVLVDAYVVMQ